MQRVLYGIGAQKAGTTWLQAQLARREGTWFSPPKELHYWDCVRPPYLAQYALDAVRRADPARATDLKGRLKARFDAGAQARAAQAARYRAIYDAAPGDHRAYLAYLGLGSGTPLVGDVTPSYALLGRATFAEMDRAVPAGGARFVFILRDPARRLWSGLGQRFRRAEREGRLSLDEKTRIFRAALADPLDPDRLRSDYARTLAELDAALPPERVHVAFFETLLDRTAGADERARLAEFLEVPVEALDPNDLVHGGAGGAKPAPELLAEAAEALAPTYAATTQRFGARVPSSWLIHPAAPKRSEPDMQGSAS